jgi:hypothetical protein
VLTWAPAVLDGPAQRPAISNLIEAERVWSIPLSFDAAQQWALAERPAGLTAEGPGFGGTYVRGGAVRLNRVYDGAGDPRWSWDELQVSIAPRDANSSYLRAGAVVSTLDQHPLPDSAAGERVRVNVAAGCPKVVSKDIGVENPGQADLDRMLVPAGAPSAALVCHYGGAGHGSKLSSSTRYGAPGAGRLAAKARAVSLAHDDNVAHSCTVGVGKVTGFVFAFPGRPDVDLWNADDGCTFISNGHVLADENGISDDPPSRKS